MGINKRLPVVPVRTGGGIAKLWKGVIHMRKALSNVSRFMMGVVPALAMVLAVHSVGSVCLFILHQPDVPERLLE
jgi:cyclic lactone autoinducer peptide